MSMERGPIGVADALIAAHRLRLTADHQLTMLVELLGLAQPTRASAEPPRPPRDPVRRRMRVSGRSPTGTEPAAEDRTATTGMRTQAEPLPAEPVAPIAYVMAEPLDPDPGRSTYSYRPIIPLQQLRAAMTMIIQRPRPSLELDIEAAVDLIAERRPFDRLPRLVEQTLDAGVTIIADVGPEMLPYLGDVAHLVDSVRRVAGEPGTRLCWIEDTDDLPTIDDAQPVMIISTMGAARAPAGPPGASEQWREITHTMIRREVDVTALVPHRRVGSTAYDQGPRFVAWDDLSEVGRGRR